MNCEKTVSIIGVGRVGGALALALDRAGWTVNQLIYRSPSSVGAMELNSRPAHLDFESEPEITSHLVLIAVRDDQIAFVADRAATWPGAPRVAMHVSGAESSAAISRFRDAGTAVGSFHPLISISNPISGADQIRGAGFCFEGDAEARGYAEALSSSLGGRLFSIPTAAKASYHAAAVMACGHFVALVDAAAEVLSDAGLSREEGRELLLPLIESTTANLRQSTTEGSLTGPFRRGDAATVGKHLAALGRNFQGEILEIYKMLGMRSLELAEREGLSGEAADAIRRKISLAK